MSVKIFVMTHKKINEPEDKIYIPLQVGKAAGQDLGYLGDDTGDNISDLNKYYGELTGVYWLWKNMEDEDYIGVCHYRRFFINENRQLMNEKEYKSILEKYDIITSNAVYTKGQSYSEDYGEAHNISDLLIIGDVIKEKYPEYYPYFEEAINGNICYYGNLMVAPKEMFCRYAEWLFGIFAEAAKRIDLSNYNLYEQRVYGFLSEQLLRVWVMKNQLKVYEGNIGIVAEKVETTEFKLAMKQLVKSRSICEARKLFYDYLKLRPDVRLELSDIKGEIPIIEQLIYIAEEEKNRNVKGLYEFSDNLSRWIEHYKKVQKILINCTEDSVGEEDKQYILDNCVSWIMIKIMILNPLTDVLDDSDKIINVLKDIYQNAGLDEYCKELQM